MGHYDQFEKYEESIRVELNFIYRIVIKQRYKISVS